MGAPQYEQAGADVAGSGTPGTIPVWSSGTTLGDSPLTVSGSNVTGAGAIRATGTSATAPAFTGSDTDTGIYFPASNQMRFATAGSFVAAFDSTGNFGIGETSPSTYGKLAITVGTTTLALNADATRADVQSYNKPLALNRLGNNTLMNEGGGNVGIGTASPSAKLEVSDGANGRFRFAGPLGTAAYADVDNFIFRSSNAGLTFGTFNGSRLDISTTTGYGIKLPATPGNADTQTLDCYQENTWSPTLTGFGGTAPTLTSARYVRVGRTVTCSVVIGATGAAAYSSTWGTTTITAPFASGEYSVVPCAREAPGGANGIQQGSTVYLPTTASSSAAFWITWTYQV